jgi:rhodanese-related sulfurtransferase
MKYLLMVISCLLIHSGCNTKHNETGIFKRLKTDEAVKILSKNQGNKDFIIIDVRTLEEYRESRIEGAINIDFYSPKFNEQIAKLDKNKIYFIYCRSGNRSAGALAKMKQFRFTEVYELDGGLIDWNKKGGPVIQ